jgi:MFS superfamily sulfate permease-like transporter
VVGGFHAGLPHFGVPSVHATDLRHLAGTAATVSFLCVVQTAATARSASTAEPVGDLNRNLVAVGAGSVVAGLAGSFPVNASPPRTAVVAASGGRTQFAGLVAAAGVVVAIAASSLLTNLPQATLGAILLFVATRLFKVQEIRHVWTFDRFEFAVAGLATLTVALLGIEQGVVVAALLALAQRTRLAARPRGTFLGQEAGTDHWIPVDIGRPTQQVDGVIVYLLYAPLWYGNAAYVLARLMAAIEESPAPVKALILDADGMSDVDYTAARQLGQMATELRRRGIQLGVARTSHLVHHDLKHSGLLADIGPDHLYATVQDAVAGLGPGPRPA